MKRAKPKRSAQTRAHLRRSRITSFQIYGAEGPVAQLLHPVGMTLGPEEVGRWLRKIDGSLPTTVKLVLSGAGLLQQQLEPSPTADDGTVLPILRGAAGEWMQPLVRAMSGAKRDYVLGVDVSVRVGRRKRQMRGQFAAVLRAGQKERLVWKTYPISEEETHLAGFGTQEGLKAPRILNTSLGKTLVLVCHDAQAFNRRAQANARKLQRKRAIKAMGQEMARGPAWVLNLIHEVARSSNLNTFRQSYKRIHEDNDWHPSVLGAFGYSGSTRGLVELAQRARYGSKTVTAATVVLL